MIAKTSLYLFFTLFFLSGIDPGSNDPFGSTMETPAYKFEVANGVLNKLKKAKGILPFEKPHLKVYMFTGSLKMAIMFPERGEIHLDELSYNICQGLQADSLNGLAFILGHELGHYLNGHSKSNHSIDTFQTTAGRDADIDRAIGDLEIANTDDLATKVKSIVKNYEETKDEAEADFEGGFLGYLAGYSPTGPGKTFLQKAYDHPFMGLNKKTPGYPDLKDRQQIVDKTSKELEALIPLFETANYLAAIEQYEDALWYYQKVAEKFKSREIYNNMGVMCLMEALQCFDKNNKLIKFEFPISLDMQTRIEEGARSISEYDSLFPLQMVNRGIDYFNQAINYDEAYPLAQLNRSIGYALISIFANDAKNMPPMGAEHRMIFKKQSLVKAESSCYDAKDIIQAVGKELNNAQSFSSMDSLNILLTNQKILSNILTQLGIIKSLQDDTPEAIKFFDQALEVLPENALASKNRIIVAGSPATISTISEEECTPCDKATARQELTIGNENLELFQIYEKILDSGDWDMKPSEIIRGTNAERFNITQESAMSDQDHYKLYYNKTALSKDRVEESIIVVPKESYTRPTACGVTRWTGDEGELSTEKDVLCKYGEPSRIFQVSDGQLLLYKPSDFNKLDGGEDWDGLMFHITPELKVKNWSLIYQYVGKPL